MSDKNKDGLIPGQSVDFDTLMKIKRQKKVVQDEPAKPKATRKAKTSASDE